MNRRIVFLTLVGLLAASLLVSACATEDVPGPRGDVGPKGPVGPQDDLGPTGDLGPDFSDHSTNAAIIVAAIGLGVGLGVLGSIVLIRARMRRRAVANNR